MSIGKICTRDVVVMRRDESLLTAARQMSEHHVGTIIIVEDHGAAPFPIGIITDRDLVRAQLKHGTDLAHLTAEQVMTRDPLYLKENDSLSGALERMRARAVRRAPVVNESGSLVGVLSVDDLIGVMAEQVAALAALIERQREREAS